MTEIAPPLDPAANGSDPAEFYELAYQLSHLARRQMHAALAAYALTPPQYAVLKAVTACRNSISVSALAEATYQVMPTVTGILNRLEERGLVVRRRSPTDRRTQLVSVTAAGESILREFGQHYRDGIKLLLAEVSPEERQFLIQIIRRLMGRFNAVLASNAEEPAFE